MVMVLRLINIMFAGRLKKGLKNTVPKQYGAGELLKRGQVGKLKRKMKLSATLN